MNAPRLHAFLSAIREFPSVREAAKAAGISRSTHYKRYDRDPEYAKLFDQAWRWGVGILRDEANRLVARGYQEHVIYKGQLQYDKRGRPVMRTVRPERLMIAVLRGELSEVYNRQRVEHTGAGGRGPIQVIVRSVLDPKE